MSIIEAEQQAAPVSVAVNIGGKEVTFETGKLAKQADGAVVVRSGDTMVLATAQGRTEAREGQDFFPLTIDVEERAYAAGKIPGGFFKREGRPTERAILTARMIDRPIRPLWPKGYRNEVQCIATVLSADMITSHDILAINGVSAALMVSPMPFFGPIGAVRVGLIDGEFVDRPDAPRAVRGEHARPDRRRHEGRPDDGRGRCRPGARGRSCSRRSTWPTRRSRSSAPPRRSSRRRPARPKWLSAEVTEEHHEPLRRRDRRTDLRARPRGRRRDRRGDPREGGRRPHDVVHRGRRPEGAPDPDVARSRPREEALGRGRGRRSGRSSRATCAGSPTPSRTRRS